MQEPTYDTQEGLERLLEGIPTSDASPSCPPCTFRRLHEYIVYPLEIYNTTAQHALQQLQSQTLYDETQAEVLLCAV